MFGGAAAPSGYLLCDGTAVSRTTYSDLFNIVGTAFGPGNGTTTFNVPDLRQRFPLGKSASGVGSTLGGTGGTDDIANAYDSISGETDGPTAFITVEGDATSNPVSVASEEHQHGLSGAVNLSGVDLFYPKFQAVNFIIKT